MRMWRNGEFTSEGFTDDGFLVGEGIFETLRCEGSRVFALDRHMRRAIAVAKNRGLSMPRESEVVDAITSIMSYGPLQLARLRLLFARDDFALTYEPYKDPDGRCLVELGALSSHKARTEKTFPYVDRLNLLAGARERGCHEVALVNHEGFVTEGAVSTFILRDRQGWFTTPLSFGVLPGVMRGLYLDYCEISVRPLSLSDISEVDAGFAVSSLRLVHAIARIGQQDLVYDRDARDMATQMRQVAVDSSVVLGHA